MAARDGPARRADGAGREHDQAGDPVGMLESDLLGDAATRRDADQMRLAHVEGVEQAERVGGQIHPGVVGVAGG